MIFASCAGPSLLGESDFNDLLGLALAQGSYCGLGLCSQPSTVSPPAGRGLPAPLQSGNMAQQKAESACFSIFSSWPVPALT